MGRGRSTLILLVVALGLGGYLYFVESERPVQEENAKKKVFTYETDKITEVQVKSSSGTTALRKGADGSWTIVQPVQAPADRNSVNDIITNLANLEEEREVDPNAADLKAYGLAEPAVDVTFQVEGDKEPKRILVGDKTPSSSHVYAKLPATNRVFLVGTSLQTAADRSTFDFRDKAALTFDQTKVQSLELASAAETIRLEKSGEEWKIVKPHSGARGFRERERPYRPAAIRSNDGAQRSARRSERSRPVRTRQTRGGCVDRHRHIDSQARAGQRCRRRCGMGARPGESGGLQHEQRRRRRRCGRR